MAPKSKSKNLPCAKSTHTHTHMDFMQSQAHALEAYRCMIRLKLLGHMIVVAWYNQRGSSQLIFVGCIYCVASMVLAGPPLMVTTGHNGYGR